MRLNYIEMQFFERICKYNQVFASLPRYVDDVYNLGCDHVFVVFVEAVHELVLKPNRSQRKRILDGFLILTHLLLLLDTK